MRAISIEQALARIARNRRWRLGGVTRARIALEDARHAQLRAELEERRKEHDRERREPGSRQREIDFNESERCDCPSHRDHRAGDDELHDQRPLGQGLCGQG